jgi:hypothetical protein
MLTAERPRPLAGTKPHQGARAVAELRALDDEHSRCPRCGALPFLRSAIGTHDIDAGQNDDGQWRVASSVRMLLSIKGPFVRTPATTLV